MRDAVIGGTLSPASHDAVVFLRAEYSAAEWADCSATLLSPRVVLTARHCVTRVQPGDFVCRGNGELVEDGSGAGTFGADVPPASITVHVGATPADAIAARGAKVFTTQSPNACRDDLAVIAIDRQVDVPEYPPLRRGRPTLVGERASLIGYGMGERRGALLRREVNDARIVDVAAPSGAAISDARATTPARSFVISGGTVCSGDSGGPALSMQSGALLGVYSRVTGDCFAEESRNTFMLASEFAPLLDAAFAETGESPRLEVSDEPPSDEPPVTGEPSDGGAGASGAAGEPEPEDTQPDATEAGHDAFACAFGSGPAAPGACAFLPVAVALGALSRRRRRRRGAS